MPIYEWRSKKDPAFVVAVVRSLSDIELPPEAEEVRRAVSADTSDTEVEKLGQDGWERCPSRRTGLAQAPGYRAGGKGVGSGFQAGRR